VFNDKNKAKDMEPEDEDKAKNLRPRLRPRPKNSRSKPYTYIIYHISRYYDTSPSTGVILENFCTF